MKETQNELSKTIPNTDDLGRAIARGMSEETARKEKNMATAEKRAKTRLENAAEQALSGRNYS